MKTTTLLLGTLASVALSAFASPAQAAQAYRSALSHGSVACAGVDSKSRGYVKSRPEGIRNVTTNIAVLQCGGVATPLSQSGDVMVYEIGFNNSTGRDIVVDCSLSDGIGLAGGVQQVLYPKSVTIPAGGAAYLSWNGQDTGGTFWNNGARFIYPAATCQLPDSAEISYTTVIYYVDVGQ